jgi:hypothetical protein
LKKQVEEGETLEGGTVNSGHPSKGQLSEISPFKKFNIFPTLK